jgi:alpha-tubulin suppressor-like RCC1 family protein
MKRVMKRKGEPFQHAQRSPLSFQPHRARLRALGATVKLIAHAGLGDEADRMTPTQVAALAHTRVLLASCGGAHTAALTDSGDLWTWGEGGWGQLGHTTGEDSLSPVLLERKLFGDARIAMVACGGGHTCAISEGGYLFSWGSGLWGQLANRARPSPPSGFSVPGTLAARLSACE